MGTGNCNSPAAWITAHAILSRRSTLSSVFVMYCSSQHAFLLLGALKLFRSVCCTTCTYIMSFTYYHCSSIYLLRDISVSSHLQYLGCLLLVDLLSRPLYQTSGYPRQSFFLFGLHLTQYKCCNISVPSSRAYGDTTR